MFDRRVELRVKIKSLAEEARIIRLEEKRAKAKGDWQLFFRLQNHRVINVRIESRAASIAYGLIRMVSVPEIEPNVRSFPDMVRVRQNLFGFGSFKAEGESDEEFRNRKAAMDQLREGQLMALEHCCREGIAAYNAKQDERAGRRRLSRELREIGGNRRTREQWHEFIGGVKEGFSAVP